MNLIRLYGRERDWTRAEAHYRDAVRIGASGTDAYYNYGVTLLMQERDGDAAAAFQQVVAANPQNAAAWTNLGQIAERRGRLDEAVERYRTALEWAPADSGTRFNFGRLLIATRQYREAIAQFEVLATDRGRTSRGMCSVSRRRGCSRVSPTKAEGLRSTRARSPTRAASRIRGGDRSRPGRGCREAARDDARRPCPARRGADAFRPGVRRAAGGRCVGRARRRGRRRSAGRTVPGRGDTLRRAHVRAPGRRRTADEPRDGALHGGRSRRRSGAPSESRASARPALAPHPCFSAPRFSTSGAPEKPCCRCSAPSRRCPRTPTPAKYAGPRAPRSPAVHEGLGAGTRC